MIGAEMARPMAILGVGLGAVIMIGLAIVPARAAAGFALMLGVVGVGVAVTVVAGFRGKRADQDRELARRSRLLTERDQLEP